MKQLLTTGDATTDDERPTTHDGHPTITIAYQKRMAQVSEKNLPWPYVTCYHIVDTVNSEIFARTLFSRNFVSFSNSLGRNTNSGC